MNRWSQRSPRGSRSAPRTARQGPIDPAADVESLQDTLHRIVSTLSYSVGTTLMTGTFDSTRFVAPPNYHSSNPFLGYRSFTIDLTALISTNK